MGLFLQFFLNPSPIVLDDCNIREKTLQSRPAERAARYGAVIVAGLARNPALVPLAGDIGGAGLGLRIERVEVLVEPLVGGFAGVKDSATGLIATRSNSFDSTARLAPSIKEPAGHLTSSIAFWELPEALR